MTEIKKEVQATEEATEEVTEFEAGKSHPDTPKSVLNEIQDPERKAPSVSDEQVLKKKKFRVVKESKAPALTADFIKEAGKKFFTVEVLIDDQVRQINVLRGVPLTTALLLQKTADIYALSRKSDEDEPPKKRSEAEGIEQTEKDEREFKQRFTASMVVEDGTLTGQITPVFSYNSIGGSIPIEDVSDKVLLILYDAVMDVQMPDGSVEALRRFHGVG